MYVYMYDWVSFSVQQTWTEHCKSITIKLYKKLFKYFPFGLKPRLFYIFQKLDGTIEIYNHPVGREISINLEEFSIFSVFLWIFGVIRISNYARQYSFLIMNICSLDF